MSKIIGNTTATPVAIPDWGQTDSSKADYIKNKPDFDGLLEQVESIEGKIGDTAVYDQINDAVSQKSQVKIIESDDSEFLETLNIHKMTQEQYNQEFENGNIDENALYLIPYNDELENKTQVTIVIWGDDD